MRTAMQELIFKLDNDILLPSNWQEKFIQKEKEMLNKYLQENCVDAYHEGTDGIYEKHFTDVV